MIIFRIIVAIIALISLAACFSEDFWGFELLAALRFQLMLASVLVLVASALLRRWVECLIILVVFGLNFGAIAPYLVPQPLNAQMLPASVKIRLLQSNVYYQNYQLSPLVEMVQEVHPDVLALEEVSAQWRRMLEGDETIRKQYPYRFYNRWGNPKGMNALLSRYPFRTENLDPLFPYHLRFTILIGHLDINGNPLTLMVFHPPHPTTPGRARIQSQAVDYLLVNEQHLPTPRILVGDMNMTPTSAQYQRLVEGLDLQNTAKILGWQMTWPVNMPWPLKLPLDTALPSQQVKILKHQVLPSIGSDHHPVLFEFAIPMKEKSNSH